jgi:putative membrane-bound dehydrogenase-like protein
MLSPRFELPGRAAAWCALLVLAALLASPAQAAPPPLNVLFLGDNGHHRPAERFRQLAPALAKRNVRLVYTDRPADLNAANLAKYDALVIYANTDRITPEQEKALLGYVEGGKGLVPLHCASFCFLNSPKYIALVGAQFRSHGTGVFRTTVAAPDHPVMKDFSGFASWDETYLHHKHNPKGRVVLEYRIDGDVKEPWTWVRTQGKGRVFYTAWGHDQRTWSHPGFINLVERGVRWAAGGDPAVVPPYVDQPVMTSLPKDLPPFRYAPAKVPYYPAGKSWGTVGKPLTTMQLPLPPDESMRHMVHPADFELKLFASDDQLGGKPICMNWDERGRLWVAVTTDYPNALKRPGQGRDRILILEDTKGTGRADKVTEFADKLSIPTSLTFYKGGVVVHQAPQTLYLKDTKGTGRADVRQVLFSGWHTNDTHAGPSNLHYGLDNWLYGIVGYSGFDGTVGGERHSFRTGFYRFKPDGSKMEFLRNTNNNSWGVGFSEEGVLFGSTANGNPSVYLPIPNRYYEAVRGWSSTVLGGIAGNAPMHPITDKVRQVDHHGHFTAAAGHALYTARTYPRYYWNRTAFVTEPTGHLIATFSIQDEGSDFRSRNAFNLLASDDEWCAPVMAEVGPDGNVWLIDWYNYIVQHNPTPAGFKTGKGGAYETELRDKKHGRIYRLVYKKARPARPTSLAGATPAALLAALRSDNMLWRTHAQRLLVERGKTDVAAELCKLVEDKTVDAVGLNAGAIHALWTLHGLGALRDGKPAAVALAALAHPSAGVRRNAVAVAPRDAKTTGAILDANLLKDADAQVRLAALLSLAELPPSDRAGAALAARLADAADMADRWIPDALTAAAAAHDFSFLEAALKLKADLPPRARAVLTTVAAHYAQAPAKGTADRVLSALNQAPLKTAEAVLAGLAQGWNKKDATPLRPETEKALAALLAKLPPAGKASLLRLSAALGSKGLGKYAAEVLKSLLATLADDKAGVPERTAAARQAVELRPADDAVLAAVLDAVSPQAGPTLTAGLLDAAAASTAPGAGAALLKRLDGWTPGARTSAVRVLLLRRGTTLALLDALEAGKVRLLDLPLDQRQALAAHPDRRVAARARKVLEQGGGLPNPDRQKVIERLTPLAKKTGNAGKGKLVFKAQCAKCHVHSGEGANIGPDLTGMAAHPKEELLVHIFDPSRSVEGNFRVYAVTTLDGKTYTGMLAAESRTTIEIVDAEAKRTTIRRSNVETLQGSPKSLMPEGFEKQLKEDEVVDLLEFLTQRGKFLPLPLDKVATAVSTRGMFFSPQSGIERLVFADWKPKTFKGVPFYLVDPRGSRTANVVLLYGPHGTQAPKMPKSVSLVCNTPARAVHLLSGVSGWGHPGGRKGSVSMIVRLHYKDGKTEDHPLRNGEHFADYIRRVDVPGSTFAFGLRGQQVRYLSVVPKRAETIARIDLVKGPDDTAPVVMAVTVETK